MKKVTVLLVLLFTISLISCTEQSLNEDNSQQIEKPKPGGVEVKHPIYRNGDVDN